MNRVLIFIISLLCPISIFGITEASFYDDNDFDGADLCSFAASYLSTTGEINYNSDADFIGDGDVDAVDFGAFVLMFGKTTIEPPEAIAEIGPAGGVVEVTEPDSAIYGVSLSLSEGIFKKESILSVAGNPTIAVPDDFPPASALVEITSDEILHGFIPVSVPLLENFTPQGRLMVRFFDDSSGTWGIYPIHSYNQEDASVTFYTNHFTTFNVFDVQHDHPFLDLSLDVYLMFGRAFLFNHINQIDDAINLEFDVADSEKAYWKFLTDMVDSMLNVADVGRAWGSPGQLLDVGLSLSIEFDVILYETMLPMIIETHGNEAVDPLVEAGSCVLQAFVENGLQNPPLQSVIMSCGPTSASQIMETAINFWTVYIVEGRLEKRNNFLVAMDYLDLYYGFAFDDRKINEYLEVDPDADINHQLNAIAKKYKDGLFLFDDWDRNMAFQHISAVWDIIHAKSQMMDIDNDGWANSNDNCPNTANIDQADSNGNGRGDLCDNTLGYTILDLTSFGDSIHTTDINNNGQVIGYESLASGGSQAFIWDAINGMQDLGTLGGSTSIAFDINESGQVVGYAYLATDNMHAFIWDPINGMQDLATFGGASSYACAINNSGQVVGNAGLASGGSHAFIWDPITGMQDLDPLGAASSYAVAINNSGQVSGSRGYQAFIWDPINGMENLDTLGESSFVNNINDAGQVVGFSFPAAGSYHAFIWDAITGMQDLGTLGGSSSNAAIINEAGQVIGILEPDEMVFHAFFWDSIKGMQDLGTLGGFYCLANDINNSGQVVGGSLLASGEYHAFIWDPTNGMEDMGIEIDGVVATCINDSGQVVVQRGWPVAP